MDELTLDEIADLRDIGFESYMGSVIRLFRSGEATPEQWAALSEAFLILFRQNAAPPSAWKTMAAMVLACSESSQGHLVTVIDRAVLASGRPRRPKETIL